MPEGDTLHRAAARLRTALVGDTVTAVDGSHPAVGAGRRRLVGARVIAVDAVGKHLVVATDRGWAVRTHLGMTGRWHLYEPGQPWTVTPGKARLVLRTGSVVAVCFAAPTVEVAREADVREGLGRLGPDLVLPDPPFAAIVARGRSAAASSVAALLLDQAVAASIGNVFKSEVMFLERMSPDTAPDTLSDADVQRLYRRAHRLLAANTVTRARTTTGARRDPYWVYGRTGQPCRRCGTRIASANHGTPARVTYWCPSCQSPIDRNATYG